MFNLKLSVLPGQIVHVLYMNDVNDNKAITFCWMNFHIKVY